MASSNAPYATFAVITDPNSLNEGEVAEILVGMSTCDEESLYEFTLRWQKSGSGTALLAEIYDDSFEAFADMPDLFKWLARQKGKATTVAQVKAALKRMTFKDVTAARES